MKEEIAKQVNHYKKLIIIISTLLLLFLMFIKKSIFNNEQPYTITEKTIIAMGTVIDIKILSQKNSETKNKANAAIDNALSKIKYLESLASVYDKNSYVTKINENAGLSPIKVPEELLYIIKDSIKISELTNGAFDITFESFLKIWKIFQNDSKLPSEDEISESKKFVDYRKIEINESDSTIFLKDKGMEIGLGAIAKGAAVDMASAEIRKLGFKNFIVDAGGDLFVSGYKNPVKKEKWIIGIKNPRKTNEFIQKLSVSDKAVVTSGDYERKVVINGKTFCHIFDPRTGKPSNKSISVTVVADKCLYADALATGFFVLGYKDSQKTLNEIKNAEFFIISPDNSINMSSNFNFYLFD